MLLLTSLGCAVRRKCNYRVVLLLLLMNAQAILPQNGALPGDVLTYHGDNLRTGWFSQETQLNTNTVNPKSFGWLATVPLDGRVDAEPLVVLNQEIEGHGVTNVVYVATEKNSVYAINADNGSILWRRKHASPVSFSYKNYDDNVLPVMGILGTPVIDRVAGKIYFVADTFIGGVDVFYLHAILLKNGKHVDKPVAIKFSTTVQDGSVWTFDPKYHLQRAGLLMANDSIYVAFGSNGDINPDISRGSIVRFDASTLEYLKAEVTDQLQEASAPYYLSSIWQSGYAPAADPGGNIYFSTGNSDPNQKSYSRWFNRPNSVIRLTADLHRMVDSFTPSNYFALDQIDADLGSAGVLVLPDQPGVTPHLAVAGGKDGRAFLLNRDHMGGYTDGGPDHVMQTVDMGPCWCGPAFFVGSDGVPRVVTGGANGVTTWKVVNSPSSHLVYEASTGPDAVGGLPDYGGVIPVISSSGTTEGSALVWYVQRPATSSDKDPGTPVTLVAYAASNLAQPLFSAPAGTWTHAVNSNANIVPTVANGKVYVASNKQLQIFGLRNGLSSGNQIPAPAPLEVPRVECPPITAAAATVDGTIGAIHDFYGTVCRVDGTELRLALRGGHSIGLDISDAVKQHHTVLLTPDRPIHVRATIDENGAAQAHFIFRSHLISPITPPDR